MANVASVVANIAIRATTEGVPEATSALKGLAAAQDNVAVISESSAKRQASATAAYNKQSIALDSTIKSMDRIAKATSVADRALAQGLITQTEHAARLDLINSKYGVATDGSTRFGTALKAANDNLAGFSSQLGPVGSILTALGPAGLAAAAAIGILAFAFKGAAESALKLADEAGKLGDTADTIGTTVENLRALQLIGGEVGVESEKLTTGLEKFSGILGQVRDGAKGATDSFNNLSPGLADNVRNAKTFDDALQLVFAGLKNADTAAASLAARELFGKGGAGFARIAASVDDVTKLGSSLNKLDVITTTQAKTWDQLGDSIARNMKLASQNVTASFAEPVLKVLDDVSKIVVELSRTFRLLAEPIAAGFATTALEEFRAEIQTLNFEIQKFGTDIAVTDLATRLFGPDFVAQVQLILRQLNAIAAALDALTALFGAAGQATNAFFTANSAKMADAGARASAALKTIGEASSTIFTSEFNGRVDTFASRFNAATGVVGTGAKEWFKFGNQMESVGNIVGVSLPPKFGKAGAAAGDAGKKALDFVDIMRNNVSALGGAATAAEKYQLQVAELAKKLQEGTISQDTFNRAVAHLEPNMVALRGVVGDLGSALSQAFINGQSKAEALNNSLKSIAATASSKAINSLLTGDFASAGLQGAIAIGGSLLSKLFGGGNNDDAKAQQEAAAKAEQARLEREKQIADAQIRAADYSLRAANAMEKSGFIVAIRQFDAESQRAFDEESKRAGDLAIWQLVAARAAERTKLIADTIEQATSTLAGNQMSEVQTRLKEIGDAAQTLGNALLESGVAAEDAAQAVSDKLLPALDKLRSSFIDDLTRQINELSGGAWINQAEDLAKKVTQMRLDAAAIGLQTDQISTFYILSAQKIIDENKLTGDSFERLAAQLGLSDAGLHEYTEAVTSSAAAVDEAAQVIVRSVQEIASTIQSNEDRLFNSLHRSQSIEDQLARFDLQAQREREAEVAAGGEAIVSLEAAQNQERLNLINDFNQQQLQAQQQAAEEALRAQQQAAEEQQRIAKESSDFLTGALKNISNFIQHFFAVASPSQSPAAALASSQSSFATQKTLALGGNRDALSGITQNAQDVINAATAYYGSSAAGQAIISNIIAQLQSLPAQVSAEQFIVNGVTTSIQTQTTTLNNSLSDLQAAMLSGNPSAVAAALSPYFNSLDINTNGLLDFNEFQQGLAGMASNSALRDMFTRLDTDNSGSISRLELINQATQQTTSAVGQVQSNTQNTAQNTQTTAQNTQTTATNAGNTASNVSTGNSILQALNTNTAWLQFIQSETALSNSNESSILSALGGIQNFTGAISSWSPGSNHATGGYITGPGTSTSDSIPAMLSAGEGVIRASRVAELGGKSWVDSVNAGGSAGNDNAMSNSLLRRLISAEVGGAQEVAQEVRALRSDMQDGAKATKRDRWRKAA